MIDPNAPTGVPFIDAARTLYRAWNFISPSVPSKITAADRAALDQAGWRVLPGKVQVWIRPDGTRGSINDANRAAAVLRSTPPIAAPSSPPSSLPTGGDILDDLLKRPRAPVPSPPTELDRLLRQTDFERLMNRPVRTSGQTVADSARAVRPRPGAAIAAVLARSVGLLVSGLLYPSSIGYEAPLRTGRRPRAVRPPPRQPPIGTLGGDRPSQPPRSLPRTPRVAPDRGPLPPKTPPAAYIPAPYQPMPVAVPAPSMPRPIPVPTSVPLPVFGLPLLPLLLPSSRPRSPTTPPSSLFVSPFTNTPTTARPIVAPLTRAITAPLGSQPPTGGNCECTRNSKPKKKRCANPVVSKRTRSEGNRKFLTITRELKCP